MVAEDMLGELKRLFCEDARVMSEAGITYIHIPKLKMPQGIEPAVMEALLCLQPRDGYPTRLFLEVPVAGKGQNWSVHHILSRGWHTCSWGGVSYTDRPSETLANHLKAFV